MYVTDELVNALFGIFVRVLVEPLIEVPVKVEIEPPSETGVAPMVMELLVSAEFGMSVKVFDSPDIVLLVRVSAPARVAKVPVVGKVSAVDPEIVKVSGNAPETVKAPPVAIFPPRVMV